MQTLKTNPILAALAVGFKRKATKRERDRLRQQKIRAFRRETVTFTTGLVVRPIKAVA